MFKDYVTTKVSTSTTVYDICELQTADQGPVVRSLVSGNRWLRGIKTYRFPWYLMLVSANHASSNPGQDIKTEEFVTNDHVCAVDVDVHQGIPVLQIRYVKTE